MQLHFKLNSFFLISALFASFSPAIHATSLVNGFDVVTLGNFTSSYTDLQGTLAVGGNLKLSGYDLNTMAPITNTVASGFDTVVAGSLTMNSGTIERNVYAGSATTSNVSICSSCLTTGANSPLDFSALASSVKSENSYLYQLTSTGSVTMPYSTLNLNASGSSLLQVFSITASQLSNNSGISINNLPTGATVVINVSDTGSHTASTSGAGLQFNGNQVSAAPNVVFNFASSITSISITNSVYASIFAPNAAVTGQYGAFNADLVAASYSGNNQFNLDPFTGTLPSATTPTPEPASIGMFGGAALIALGLFKRKGVKKS